MRSFLNLYAIRLAGPTVTAVQNPDGRPFVAVRLSNDATVHINSAEDGDALAAAFTEAARRLREAEQAVTA